MGYIPYVDTENLFGKTFGDISSIVRQNLDSGDTYEMQTKGYPKPDTFKNPYAFNYSKEEREIKRKHH